MDALAYRYEQRRIQAEVRVGHGDLRTGPKKVGNHCAHSPRVHSIRLPDLTPAWQGLSAIATSSRRSRHSSTGVVAVRVANTHGSVLDFRRSRAGRRTLVVHEWPRVW
jgi:hypothetical protein